MNKIGCCVSENDIVLFFLGQGAYKVIILVYVENKIVIGKDKATFYRFDKKMEEHVNIRIYDEPRKFVRMIIERSKDRQTLKLHKAPIISRISIQFEVEHSAAVHVPIQAAVIKYEEDAEVNPYRSVFWWVL
ncbi:hypothetical protein BWQ96_04166 [Gracilariopsis chorda]|uniref:Uncharacterized protein n=1 Tax=Gracilariopsis chorda TaxID=448386 RepID=A0A2V3IV95_9FLOR|nr:hypothetical protein BWQ96_04166 [Gracilariopsis chorda]|eukprot:PXF46066.1 hypothetical protein BWQ96_04166 [Gracilariopsis chorda]